MAAEMTETVYDVVPNFNGRIIKVKYTAASTGDWLILDNPIGTFVANDLTGAPTTHTYAVGAVHTSGITSSSTEMIYDGVTAEQMPTSGYIRLAGGEIVKYSDVTKADSSGTMTLDERECFGTSAEATDADGVVFYILNTLIIACTAGPVRGIAEIIDE